MSALTVSLAMQNKIMEYIRTRDVTKEVGDFRVEGADPE